MTAARAPRCGDDDNAEVLRAAQGAAVCQQPSVRHDVQQRRGPILSQVLLHSAQIPPVRLLHHLLGESRRGYRLFLERSWSFVRADIPASEGVDGLCVCVSAGTVCAAQPHSKT